MQFAIGVRLTILGNKGLLGKGASSMAALRSLFLCQLALVALLSAIANRSHGFDMAFIRVDTADQVTSGTSNAGTIDLCVPDPMSFESDFDATGTMNNQNSDYATLGGGVTAATNDCAAITAFLSSARNFTAQMTSTYAPNVTAAAEVEILLNTACECDYGSYNSSWSSGSAKGTYEAQQEGLVTAEGSIVAWEYGDVGPDGATIGAPNMSVILQSTPGGYVAWVDVYDEELDDSTIVNGEWWCGLLSVTFFSSKYVSQYEELDLLALAQAKSEPVYSSPMTYATNPAVLNTKGISAMAAMYGEY